MAVLEMYFLADRLSTPVFGDRIMDKMAERMNDTPYMLRLKVAKHAYDAL